MESAGEEEKSDHTHERKNDELIVFFHYCVYCGHFKPPLIYKNGRVYLSLQIYILMW